MATDVERHDMLLEAGLALASELSLQGVLQRIIELAVQITDATYGALGVLGPGGEISKFLTTGVTPEERRLIGHPPIGRGILGVLIHDASPLRLHDISHDPRSVGFPPNHPPMRTFLGAPVKARNKVFGNIYLTEKRGGADFDDDDEQALLVLANQAGVAVENATLYDEARRRQRWLEASSEISSAILAGEHPEAVLGIIARNARTLVEADLASIAVPADDPGSLVVRVADGQLSEQLMGTVFPLETSVSGEVIRTGEPAWLEDASTDPRVYQPMVRLGRIGPAILVPLHLRGSAFGTLAVANRAGGDAFSQVDLTLVESLADQASVAIEYGRAQQELKRLAVMEDRERIAKELHDGVIQSLFAMGMGLQATATMSRDPEIERRIEGAVGEMDRVIRDLRNYIFGLRPGILADRELDQALRRLAEDFQEKTGVVTVVHVDGGVASALSPSAGDIIQLAREALSNVGRHAQAVTCRVSLRSEDGRAVLEIDDDGTGFDPSTAREGGQGLRNLKQRASSLGGEIQIESSPDQGTTVRALLPL